jgi:hypothetical protein
MADQAPRVTFSSGAIIFAWVKPVAGGFLFQIASERGDTESEPEVIAKALDTVTKTGVRGWGSEGAWVWVPSSAISCIAGRGAGPDW